MAMRSEILPRGQETHTFVETARRAQLVECAISVIAELGYSKTSLAEIAHRAGVSKGVISYHFAGKSELIQQVVGYALEKGSAVMFPRIMAEQTARGMLRAYIESNLEFLDSHRDYLKALFNISVGLAEDDRKSKKDLGRRFNQVTRDLENLLRHGQERGEFREFSTKVMATTIRSALDAAIMAEDPKLGLKVHANELATLFDLATRK